MKKIDIILLGLVGIAAMGAVTSNDQKSTLQPERMQNQNLKTESEQPQSRKHEAVVLQSHENYTYKQLSSNAWTSGFAGMRVYNSSSSAGAPVFTNLAWHSSSAAFTNEFGGVEQGRSSETTKPSQIGDAIAQLLDDGFRILSISTPSDTSGNGPTTYVFVKP